MTRSFFAAALLVLAGCDVTETGNPPLTVGAQMALTAHTSDEAAASIPTPAGGGAGGAGVHVATAWASFGDIRLVQGEVCDVPGEVEIDLPVPVIEDLATSRPPLQFMAADADYCRVRVRFDRLRGAVPAGAPAELADHSLVVSGRTPGGADFRIVSRIERDADVRSRGAPFPIDDARRALALSFDVAGWFETLDLDAATPGAGGTIVISEDENRDVLEAFEENVESALELHRDGDEDGSLEPSEISAPLAVGGP